MRRADTALLLIDLVNPLRFPGAEALFVHALPAARRLAALKARARAAGIPAIYVNDNFDSWHEGFRELVQQVRTSSPQGRQLMEILEPDPAVDHFILKPMHSAFFQTGLETLLHRLGARTLILTGIATEICVLFTANDAHMRRYRVIVPSDCVASEDPSERDHALALMRRIVDADVRPSTALRLDPSRIVMPAIAGAAPDSTAGGER